MNQLRGFVLGLATIVSLAGLVLVAGMAGDFISERIASRLGVAGVAACTAVVVVLPGVLSYASARSGHLVAVALIFVPAVACVFAGVILTVRGPLGEVLRAGLGRGGTVMVAVTAFGLSGLGGLLGWLFGKPARGSRS